MSTKFGLQIDFDLLNTATLTNRNPEVVLSRSGRHIEKSIWRHISAVGEPILTKFGRLMHNYTPITVKWSKTKPEVEFQYGRRLFFQNRSSYIILALNWDMSTKFDLLIDFDFLNTVTSTNTKTEVVLSRRGRHIEKSMWRYISALSAPT